ncbi:pantoate--beta-alanine ligase [Bacillus sp. H-16]|uniref:pantoate--beta-alanine ligase n=1 Tax=Alteribacter salitolerans TaxID=2912333 RepID=UPI0019668200|nr:pantoate--beta-alanine ligase [Alteribacter salitolerans]MBM7094621.1 pantoate--beta-alanine ligase [Alteribacter salitolerans]
MIVVRTVNELREHHQKARGMATGFVPTMGYLHKGHQALIKQASTECDFVVSSIFVNPLQFGEGEDYSTYPRNEQRDIELANEAGADLLFIPNVNEMYKEPMSSLITVKKGADSLCGKSRPGHFDGVLTVVMKLFWMVMPNKAYFGIKDAQQVALLETMVKDYHIPVDIIRVPTVREEDGLAKSSRNVNLTQEERLKASHIHGALNKAVKHARSFTNAPAEVVSECVREINELTSGEVDYVELRSFPSLEKIQSLDDMKNTREVIIACAVRFSKARLIDNLIFTTNDLEEKK